MTVYRLKGGVVEIVRSGSNKMVEIKDEIVNVQVPDTDVTLCENISSVTNAETIPEFADTYVNLMNSNAYSIMKKTEITEMMFKASIWGQESLGVIMKSLF